MRRFRCAGSSDTWRTPPPLAEELLEELEGLALFGVDLAVRGDHLARRFEEELALGGRDALRVDVLGARRDLEPLLDHGALVLVEGELLGHLLDEGALGLFHFE